MVDNGIRLDRLENTGGRTVALLTNLNDLPGDVDVSIAVFKGGDLPAYELSGTTTLVDTGTVILEEESGQAVECPDMCSYSLDAELSFNPDLEPYTNETTCTYDVCRLDPASTPTPTG